MTRREAIVTLGAAAAAAGVVRVAGSTDLSDEEYALLFMSSRDFTPGNMHEFPHFDRYGATAALGRSMVDRGLLALVDTYIVAADGEVVLSTFVDTPYGAEVLRRETARRAAA